MNESHDLLIVCGPVTPSRHSDSNGRVSIKIGKWFDVEHLIAYSINTRVSLTLSRWDETSINLLCLTPDHITGRGRAPAVKELKNVVVSLGHEDFSCVSCLGGQPKWFV